MSEKKKFEPTAAQRKLLDVMLDPRYKNLDITKTCKKAGISRTLYYRYMDNPAFKEYYHEQAQMLLKGFVGPAINALGEKAARGSFNHIKLVMEMTGIYTPNQKIEVEERVVVVGDIDEEDGESVDSETID